MYFRFAVGLVLAIGISLAGTALEKQNLELKQAVARQYFRLDVLTDTVARKRSRAESAGAPTALIDALDSEPVARPTPPGKSRAMARPANPGRSKSAARP